VICWMFIHIYVARSPHCAFHHLTGDAPRRSPSNHQLDFFIIDPLHQTSASQSLCLISPQVESAVLRRLKVLKRLQDVHLRPKETQALMQRVETNTGYPFKPGQFLT
jgi:hypothetical protein